MEVFATGLALGESPRWHEGRLWVCEWVAGEVLSFDAAGERRVELTITGLPFSVDWLPDGRTVLTSTTGVVTLGADGSTTPYGVIGQGWNEIVVDPRGKTFVNSIGFDLMSGEEPRAGTVLVVRPDGSSTEVAGDVWFPNGMAITSDGDTLIVAESYGPILTAFDIGPDGTLTNRRVWADLSTASCRIRNICSSSSSGLVSEDSMTCRSRPGSFWATWLIRPRCRRATAEVTAKESSCGVLGRNLPDSIRRRTDSVSVWAS